MKNVAQNLHNFCSSFNSIAVVTTAMLGRVKGFTKPLCMERAVTTVICTVIQRVYETLHYWKLGCPQIYMMHDGLSRWAKFTVGEGAERS